MVESVPAEPSLLHRCLTFCSFTHLLRSPPKYPYDLSAYESHLTTWSMNTNNVNTCVSLYRVTVAEVWNSLNNLGKKTRNCATHSVILVIPVGRVTSAIATSARITSAYFARIILCILLLFRDYNILHC